MDKLVKEGYRSGLLVDLNGNPIVNEEEKHRAASLLREFMEKYRERFQDWFKEYGPNVKPPIKYDCSKREWFWLD